MTNYDSIQEVFEILNKAGVKYLVLRNYDNLLSPSMYMDGHGDVDLLCADSHELAQAINAETKTHDGTHYYIHVGGEYVSLDLRHVGDDYYCEQWESDLLDRREKHECYYVMAAEDYFYTLIYHAILQKTELSDEYRVRLDRMAQDLNITLLGNTEAHFICLLEQHMKEQGYKFVFTVDSCVPARFRLVDSGMVERKMGNYWRHLLFHTRVKIIETLVKIKHAVYK